MRQKYITFITTLLLLSGLSLSAQYDTRGTEFWLTFGNNDWKSYDTVDFQIRITTGGQATTGNIYFTHLNNSVSFSVAAWSIFTHSLTLAQRQTVYNDTTGIKDYSIHITTNNPVTVYALNRFPATADATHILPVTALGTDYYQISYGTHDAYAVVATQNNTQVYHNGTFVLMLNRGQVYYHLSTADMTGDRITADKPVAFFALQPITSIPEWGYWAGDHLFEQLAPIYTWGKNFFVPVSCRGRDFVRIVASQNGTTISQTGGTMRTATGGQTRLTNLNAGQWVELEVSLANNGCYIQADRPVGVCAYLTSTQYNHDINGYTISDPAQAWVPALEQEISSALVAPFIPYDTTNYNLNLYHALVITPTATKDSTTVTVGMGTEQALSGGTWRNHSSGYSFYDMPLTNDTLAYLFTNTAGKIIVMGYATGWYESYYYLLASAMRNLDAVFYINDIHYQELSSIAICEQPVQFRAEIDGDMSTNPGHLKWYINNVEEIAARDQLMWSKNMDTGVYQIKLVVLYEDDINTQTLETTLTVWDNTVDITTTPEICNKADGTITLTVDSKDTSALKYIWEGRTDTTANLTGLKAGTYKVTVSDRFCVDEETIVVEHIEPPVAAFEPNPQTASLGEEIQFTDKSLPGEGAITNWYWNFGDSTDSDLQNPAHRYTTAQGYMVWLHIEDEFGCRDSIAHEVLVLGSLDFPNIFTPIGSDGRKYVFRPLEDQSYYEEFTIEIYDRWGVPVWSKQCKSPNCPDYDDAFWWDGTNKLGKQVSDGVYYWVVYARYYSTDIKPLVKNGSVTVISK